MGGYIFLALIVSLIVNGFVAVKFKEIAEMKGHEGSAYFWFTFLLGVVGMLMVIALPNTNSVHINNLPNIHTTSKQTAPPVTAAAPVVTEKNPNKSNAPIGAEIKDGEKICPKCGTAQKVDRHVCWSCGQPFDN